MPATLDAHYQSDIILIGGRVADTTATGGIAMNAQSEGMRGLRLVLDYTPFLDVRNGRFFSERPGIYRLVPPWVYRHPGFYGGGHVIGGSVAAAAGLICLSYGVYGWAAFFLAVGALNLAGGSWYLSIARSASARS
jgi:hypothetical protein